MSRLSDKNNKWPFNKKTLDILKALCHFNKEQRKSFLRKADKSLIKIICECVLNILKGNVKLTKSQIINLKRHVKLLRKLGSTNDNWSRKKTLIVQSGGGFLLPLLTPIFSAFLSSVIN